MLPLSVRNVTYLTYLMLVYRLPCCWRCCSQPPRPMSCLMTSCSCQKVCFLCNVCICYPSFLPLLLGCRVTESRMSNTECCEVDAVTIMQGTLCTMDLVRESCLTSTAWYAFSHACLALLISYCLSGLLVLHFWLFYLLISCVISFSASILSATTRPYRGTHPAGLRL